MRVWTPNQILHSVTTHKLAHKHTHMHPHPKITSKPISCSQGFPLFRYLSLCTSVVWNNLILPLRHSSHTPGEQWTLNITQTLRLVLAASMPRLLTGCELKGAAWFYPLAVAVWRSSHCTLPLQPQTGSENGMRHSRVWCSGGWNGHKCWWWGKTTTSLSMDGLCNIVLMYYLCYAKIPPLE